MNRLNGGTLVHNSEGKVIDIFIFGSEKIGELIMTECGNSVISFTYSTEWVEKGFQLSPYLPLKLKQSPVKVKTFLSNLLPEGRGLEETIEFYSASKYDLYSLLKFLGNESYGALSFFSRESSANCPDKTSITDIEIEQKFQYDYLSIWSDESRLSVSGVQDKINYTELNGCKFFGSNRQPSNKILKIENSHNTNIAVNEFFTMTLAKLSGIEVADIKLTKVGECRAVELNRFDRKTDHVNKSISRLHIIDGCQATNLPPDYKYERQFGDEGEGALFRDGVSFEKLLKVQTTDEHYKKKVTLWMLFNLLNGNYDAHGKNISYFVNYDGLSLAPFYDLVNIKALLLSQNDTHGNRGNSVPEYFAMSVGDHEIGTEGNFKAPISSYMLADFALNFNFDLEYFSHLVREFTETVLHSINEAKLQVLTFTISDSEKEHLGLCCSLTEQECIRLLEICNQIPKMEEWL